MDTKKSIVCESVDKILSQHAVVMREELLRFRGTEQSALMDVLFEPMLVRQRLLKIKRKQT